MPGEILGADLRQAARRRRAMPALPGAHSSSGPVPGAPQRADDRVLAPAAADDEDPQVGSRSVYRALPSSSAGIAAIVWLVIVPREPSSTETLAIVLSSGASTMVTKS